MRALGAVIAVCPRPPTVLGVRGSPLFWFFAPGAWSSWAQARRGLLAALRRARQRRRRPAV